MRSKFPCVRSSHDLCVRTEEHSLDRFVCVYIIIFCISIVLSVYLLFVSVYVCLCVYVLYDVLMYILFCSKN